MLASSAAQECKIPRHRLPPCIAWPPLLVFSAIVKLAKCDCQATNCKEVYSVPGAYRVLWSRSLHHINDSDAHGCHLPC